MKDCVSVFRDHHKHLSWKQCRASWLDCNDDNIRKLVVTEAIDHARTISDEENVDKILEKFTITEIQDYLKYTEGLEVPPMRPYMLYGNTLKDFPPLRKVTKSIETATQTQFCNITFNMQIIYFRRFRVRWIKFEKTLRKWRAKNRDYFDVALDNKAFSFKNELQRKKNLPTKPKRRTFVEVCMPYTKCDFENEPKHNPLTLHSLLKHILEYTVESEEDLNAIFNSFPMVVRKCLEEQVWQYRNDYRSSLLGFIAGLSESKRKLFLGYRRKPIYKKMMEDIFKKLYPVDKYPVYKINTDSFLQRKKKVKLDSTRDLSSNDEVDLVQVIYNSFDVFKSWDYNMESSDSDSEIKHSFLTN